MNKKKSAIKKLAAKQSKKVVKKAVSTIKKTVKKVIAKQKSRIKPKVKIVVKPKPKLKPKPRPRPKPKAVVKAVVKPKPQPKPKVQIVLRPKETVIDSKENTDMQILENLLGGQNKVRLWKVFVLNPVKDFVLKDLIRLTKIKHDTLILELRDLMKFGIIKAGRKEKVISYRTNRNFPLLSEITEMVLSVVPRSVEKILEKLNRLNRLKVVVLSGFFTSSKFTNSNLDLLLVFEKIPDNVDVIVSELEYSIGKELSYSALDQTDFKYRHSIGDKLIRDVLDFEHIVAMDKLSFFR